MPVRLRKWRDIPRWQRLVIVPGLPVLIVLEVLSLLGELDVIPGHKAWSVVMLVLNLAVAAGGIAYLVWQIRPPKKVDRS